MGEVKLTNIIKRFGNTEVIKNLSLHIKDGEFLVLVGGSGCGKSTTLRLIAGLESATEGVIMIGDKDVTDVPPKSRDIAMVFQNYALYPHMTVYENIAFGLKLRKMDKATIDRKVNEAADMLDIRPYLQRKPKELSGGQRQRVALGRALVRDAQVFLMDEPLSNLDAKLRLEMRTEIRRICKETGITTVYVTHDQKEALSMADGIAVLDMGVVAQIGPPRTLYERPASRFVADFLGETNFIHAEVKGREGEALILETPAGELRSTAYDHAAPPEKGNVTCSIRPEALRIIDSPGAPGAPAPGILPGRVAETIYLGEMAQHIVELPGDTRIKVFELHPTHFADQQRDMTLAVSPDDVVVLAN